MRNVLVVRLHYHTLGSSIRIVTFGQPLQGVHLIDKSCPRLWTTQSMYGLIIHLYIVANNLLITCVVI
jgi:hypothetical protein